MKELIIYATCDVCGGSELGEEAEQITTVEFIINGMHSELEMCIECINGSFFQEARPIKRKRKAEAKAKATQYKCNSCDQTYSTHRGVVVHQRMSDNCRFVCEDGTHYCTEV